MGWVRTEGDRDRPGGQVDYGQVDPDDPDPPGISNTAGDTVNPGRREHVGNDGALIKPSVLPRINRPVVQVQSAGRQGDDRGLPHDRGAITKGQAQIARGQVFDPH